MEVREKRIGRLVGQDGVFVQHGRDIYFLSSAALRASAKQNMLVHQLHGGWVYIDGVSWDSVKGVRTGSLLLSHDVGVGLLGVLHLGATHSVSLSL